MTRMIVHADRAPWVLGKARCAHVCRYTMRMDRKAFDLDAAQARRAFARAAPTHAQAAALAREVAQRMAERLDYIRHEPRRVLDAGAGTGDDLRLLALRYPRAGLIGLDAAQPMLRQARGAGGLLERLRARVLGRARHLVCGEFSSLPLKGASIGMVWSNLALAWAGDAGAAFSEFHRVLAPGGLLMFSSYGPDTLKELKAAFGAAGERRVHSFADMHDLGDLLLASGFAAPVMDMEMLTLTYTDVDALARELKATGQTNAARARSRGLAGRGAWARMREAYEREHRDGRLPATIEVIYGHAWRGERRIAADGRQVMKLDFNVRPSR